MDVTLSEKIRLYRDRMGYSQGEFGALFDVKNSTYSTWERTGNFPDEILPQIAEKFGMTLSQLLNGVLDEQPPIFPIQEPMETSRLEDSNTSFAPKTPEEFFTLKATEKVLIRVYRNLDKGERAKVIEFANSLYQRKKKK